MKQRVTQKDVARKAGVSHMTVSLAMRDHFSIPTQTRKLIKKIARQIGYSPDPMLSCLSAYRTSQRPAAYHSNIAWINVLKDPHNMYKGGFREYYLGAQIRAKELGYNLEEIRLVDFDNQPRHMEKALIAKGIKGLILPPADQPEAKLFLDYSRFSAVRLGYSFSYPVLFTVTNAQFRTALNITKKLSNIGYRRIGLFLTKNLNDRTNWNFIGGFAAGQQFVTSENRMTPYVANDPDSKELSQWISENQPDVVVGLALWELIQKTKIKIAYADLALNIREKHMTGMCQNDLLIGKAAVDSLSGLMHRGDTGLPKEYQHLLIESEWVPGKTAPRRIKSK